MSYDDIIPIPIKKIKKNHRPPKIVNFLKNKRPIEIFATVIISSVLLTVFVYAATTIGSNISTDGNLTVSGNVGIGTTTPSASLNVVSSGIGATPALITGYSTGQTADLLQISKNYGATPAFVITSAGQVGIGTTTPDVPLQVTTASANATTTMEIGKANQNKGTCLKMYDAVGVLKYVSIQGGSLVVSDNSCN